MAKKPGDLAKKIVSEVCDKVKDYETSMASFLSDVDEWGDLVRVRRPSRKSNSFSNPRLTEMFRAANALSTTCYRMMTAQDPYIETVPMELMPDDGDVGRQLSTIQGVLETQAQESSYKPYLLQGIMSGITFGTVVVQEDFKMIGVSALGRRLPITTFTPRSMLQVAYDTGCTDLDDADWIATIDLISDSGLRALGKQPGYNPKATEDAAKSESNSQDIAPEILKRLRKYGYLNNGKIDRKESLCYHGKLDCLDDGVEYVVGVVNRKDMIRFEASANQWGKRGFRIATWIKDPLMIEARGWGLGDIVGKLHKSLDANRQKIQDKLTFGVYGMMERLRSAGIDDNDLKLRPMQIIDTDERNGLNPIRVDMAAAQQGLLLEELMRSEFKAASGATDTLQAQITNATASEVSLAQNESMRAISVRAELMAEPLVRQHFSIMHGNNARFIKSPFTINRYLGPQRVYPKDLRCDVDFKLRMTTDKDYRPKRTETLAQVLQIVTSTKSMHPELASIAIAPILEELLRSLGVQMKKLTPEEQMQGMQMQALQRQVVGQSTGGMNGQAQEAAGQEAMLGGGGAEQMVQTPVGPTLASPQG
jgi:hypothetical protein